MIKKNSFFLLFSALCILLFFDGITFSHTIMTKSFSQTKTEKIWKENGRVFFTLRNETFSILESEVLFIEYDKKSANPVQVKNDSDPKEDFISLQLNHIGINPEKTEYVRSFLINDKYTVDCYFYWQEGFKGAYFYSPQANRYVIYNNSKDMKLFSSLSKGDLDKWKKQISNDFFKLAEFNFYKTISKSKTAKTNPYKRNNPKLKSAIESMLSSETKYDFIQFIRSKRENQITLEVNGKLTNFTGSPNPEYVTVNSITFDFDRYSLPLPEFKTSFAQKKQETINKYFYLSNASLYNKDYTAALIYYDKISSLDAMSYQSYYGKGICFLVNGQYQNAIEQLNHAIELNPLDTNSILCRGIAYEKLQKKANAIKDYTQAIKQDSQNFIAYGLRGAIRYNYQPDLDLISQDAEKFNQLIGNANNPNMYFKDLHVTAFIRDRLKYLNQIYSDILGAKGITLLNQKNDKAAIQYFDRAIIVNPDNAQSYFSRGNAWMHEGQFSFAKQDFEKALILRPDEKTYREMLLQLDIEMVNQSMSEVRHLIGTGQHDLALRQLRTIKTDVGDNACIHNLYGKIWQAKNDFEKAEISFKKALELDCDNEFYISDYENILTLKTAQKTKRLIKDADRWVDVGDYQNAIKRYTEALAINPKNPELYFLRAQAYRKSGGENKALDDAKMAKELAPEIIKYNNFISDLKREQEYYIISQVVFIGLLTLAIFVINLLVSRIKQWTVRQIKKTKLQPILPLSRTVEWMARQIKKIKLQPIKVKGLVFQEDEDVYTYVENLMLSSEIKGSLWGKISIILFAFMGFLISNTFVGMFLGGLLGGFISHIFCYTNQKNSFKVDQDFVKLLLLPVCMKLANEDGQIPKNINDKIVTFADESFQDEKKDTAYKILKRVRTDEYSVFEYAALLQIAFDKTTVSVEERKQMYSFVFAISISGNCLSENKRKLLLKLPEYFYLPALVFSECCEQYGVNEKTEMNHSIDDFYKILGCSPKSSKDEIKSAYRKKSKAFHPDKISSKDVPQEFLDFAKEQFVIINEAYEALIKIHSRT